MSVVYFIYNIDIDINSKRDKELLEEDLSKYEYFDQKNKQIAIKNIPINIEIEPDYAIVEVEKNNANDYYNYIDGKLNIKQTGYYKIVNEKSYFEEFECNYFVLYSKSIKNLNDCGLLDYVKLTPNIIIVQIIEQFKNIFIDRLNKLKIRSKEISKLTYVKYKKYSIMIRENIENISSYNLFKLLDPITCLPTNINNFNIIVKLLKNKINNTKIKFSSTIGYSENESDKILSNESPYVKVVYLNKLISHLNDRSNN